ncbi:MAG: transcriptional repressor [Trueperaceae bacterium]|jgi:Fur family ferric uptake transcriptional regulator|nr:transcriptional repressor [Trueperaceae bacterium]MCH2667352.1 transcriptional repressor [Deinococcales bacterium]
MNRNTLQKTAILRALQKASGPVTPKELRDLTQTELKGIGLATIYRNLHRLQEQGKVTPVHLPNDSTRYEPSGRDHHHHFRCESCNMVFELLSSCPPPEETTVPNGFAVHGHELVLYGLCIDCQG